MIIKWVKAILSTGGDWILQYNALLVVKQLAGQLDLGIVYKHVFGYIL